MRNSEAILYGILFLVIHFYLFSKHSKLQQAIKANCKFYDSITDLGSVGNIGTAIRVLTVLSIIVVIRYCIDFITVQIRYVITLLP